MMVLVTYDVETVTTDGRRRLRKVAKLCLNYGQRVQNSVFECSVDPGQFVSLKKQIEKIIDPSSDSIRFYLLGKNWERRVESIGKDETYNPDTGFLLL
ncbi:CRISPR-associated endonuclease Cas2 [Facklamia lactis]|uniref:CRISPR-associated endonuclease Cas2 n=1 Tax=Facklamia lactis TaxID=2749967 RepID=UPI0018CE06F2|nr:CRISPR-associated endonuclease Cas2 [Facklamia lactis]MBG9980395.1 CRISPR-associated endonuclease Cas2 [Facklamia lactis]